MNQIYACRKGREIPFTDATRISTVPTAKRSGSRTVISNLLVGVLALCLFTSLNVTAQSNRGINPSTGNVRELKVQQVNQGRLFSSGPRVVFTGRASVTDKVFNNCNGNDINPADGPDGVDAPDYPSIINVTGMPLFTTKVTVEIGNFSSDFPADADIILESPTGLRVTLMSDALGTSGVVNETYIFDQSAATQLPSTTAPGGTYRPADYGTPPDNYPAPGPGAVSPAANLNTFNGTLAAHNPNGNWRLFVVDDASADFVNIDYWCLTVEAVTTMSVTATPSTGGAAASVSPASTTGSIIICSGGSYGFSGFSTVPPNPPHQVGVRIVRTGTTANVNFGPVPPFCAAPLTNGTTDIVPANVNTYFNTTHGSFCLTSGTSGSFTETYTPYYDLDGSNSFTAGDDLGTPVSITYNVYAPASTTATSSTICSGATTNIALSATPGGGTFTWTVGPITGGITGATPCAAACGTTISQTLTNPGNTDGTVQYDITYTSPGGCTVTFSHTVTVRPTPEGVIINSGGQTVCVGDPGQVNINLVGTPNFAGTFSATVLNGAPGGANTNFNWTSTNAGGPQAITVPAGSLTNTSNSPIIYRIAWVSLSDFTQGTPSCGALVSELQGFEDITVMPLPQLMVTRTSPTGAGPFCPGTTFTFRVEHTAGNTVPGNFQWFANGVLQGSNIDFDAAGGATVSFTTPSCAGAPINTNWAFLFQPRADATPNCQGSDVTVNEVTQDNTIPSFNAAGLGGAQGNVCMPPQATYQPSIATIRGRSSDNCTAQANLSISLTSAVLSAGSNNCAWTWTYNYSITDQCGNVRNISVVFTGGDTQAPTWTSAPGSLNTTIEYCNVAALNAAQLFTPVATDNCNPTPNVVKTAGVFAVGSCPTTGTFTNTWVAGDGCNNTSVVFTQTITVVDTQGPSITGPNTQTLNIGAGAGCQVPLPNYILGTGGVAPNSPLTPLTITDCAAPGGFPPPPAIVWNQAGGNSTSVQSPAPGTLIIGAGGQVVPVTITATDACGNTSSFTINVTLLDQTPPVARCHNVTLALGAGGTATLNTSQINGNNNAGAPAGNGTAPSGTPAGSGLGTGTNPSTDNCSPVPTPPLSLTFQSNGLTTTTFSCANIGNNNVTLVVTDAAGNFSTCPVTVNVVDQIAPTFTCPGPLTLSRNANCVATLPNLATQFNVVATDNCTPSGSIVWLQNPAPGTIYGAGVTSTNVTLVAQDAVGNTSTTCNITVNFVDNTAPIITCPATVNATTGAGNTNCNVAVTYTLPTATDNCQGPGFPGAVPVTLVSGPASGGQFFVGTTAVTYRATDAAGNSATCTFNVVVTDNTLPTVVCQADKTVNAGVGCVYTYNLGNAWNPTAFDNCLLAAQPFAWSIDGGLFFSAPNLNGTTFGLGNHTVTVRVTDASGNVSLTCTFNVLVLDAAVPAFSNCPTNFTVTTAAPNGLSGCRANVTIPAPTVTGNCTTVQEWFITSVTSGTPNSSGVGTFPTTYPMNVGITQVQFRLSDANGNSTTCTYNVTVQNVVAGAISGTATAAQNAATTSTITFTGSGGTPNYTFTYDVSVNGGPFGAPQSVSTTGGQSVVTVAQSNAVVGTYQYRLLSVTDASGCAGSITAPNTATVTVVTGTPDLTSSQFFTTTQIAAGGIIDEVIVIRNVGTAPTSGPISFTVTNYSALTGLTVTQRAAGSTATIGIDTYTASAGWTFNSATGTVTSNNVIPAGGSQTIIMRITRGTGASAGANGSVTQTTTIAAGTGGGETPSTNNTISNTLLKN